jgi:hypothetical protein
MPTFDFTAPDGKSYSVDGPDGATPEQAFQILQQHLGSPPSTSGVGATAADIAKSAGIGAAKGAMGLVGLPGDLSDLLARGTQAATNYIADKTGLDRGPQIGAPVLPTSGSIQKDWEDATGGLYKPKTTAGEYAQTAGEFLPALVGGPETLGTKLLTRVAVPAITSETAGQLTKGTDAEPYARVAGALASPAVIAAGRRAITPLPATAERQALVNDLRGEGVPLTAGQATGNKPLQWMESALGDTVGSGGPAARVMENQGEQFTAAALRRAGINANRATPDVIDNAFRRIGNDFEAVGQRNNVIADRRLGADMTNVENEYNNVVSPSNRAPVIENTAQDIGDMMAANGGHLTGEQYNAITSRLTRQARGARADPQLHEALQGLRTSLDDAMERSLFRTGNSADMQILRNARNEYRNMMVLERAATGAGSNAAEGLISPSQLRNAVVQQNRRAYGRGQGDFADLARAGEALLKPLPQSGTSPRQNVTSMIHTLGAVVGGGAGSAGGPLGTAAGAMAGMAAPAIAGRALMSRPVQAWLSNQLLAGGNMPNRTRDYLMKLLLSSGSQRALPGQ